MKKYILLTALIIFVLSACYKGYTTKDGKDLTKYLESKNLKKITDNENDSIIIIDVRPASAYKKGHIPSAKSFPSSNIEDNLDELPKNKNIILYCETGGRAQNVLKKLKKKGYKKMMNWGSYKNWEYELESE